ncbi:hypothetical protein [Lacticaseibacillus songhuajiangensis]|jgi:predicted DNA repair protein MutK|uniref:hypothetical protein n=1 Tax=Lacticaseibacillus songhuajiangensis TaxID=1296539 RepID=UPI000F7BA21C|nr:hypothetical protein [Lacticaseibacillus songhuajiangensis]MCI1283582.1 hypothetical protein [Lacticaseibacillus songhuajiangensis]
MKNKTALILISAGLLIIMFSPLGGRILYLPLLAIGGVLLAWGFLLLRANRKVLHYEEMNRRQEKKKGRAPHAD